MTRIETIAEGVTDKWVTIYALCEPVDKWRTGPIRYVGKTVQTPWHRVRAHSYVAKSRAKLPLHRWLRKHMAVGNPFHIKHLEHVPPGQNWVERERFWIAKLRQEGARLFNLTDGGEGLDGLRMSAAHKAKIAKALRTGGTFACQRCGSLFWRKRNEIGRGHNKFCSRSCSNRRSVPHG